MAISRPTMKSHPFKAAPFRLSNTLTNLYSLGCAQSFGRLELHIEVHVKFTSDRALYWLANEEARERIGVDAVRGIGPLRTIRREVNRPAPAAVSRCGTSTGHLFHRCSTEVKGNTVKLQLLSTNRPPVKIASTLPYQFATGVLSRWIRQRQQRRVLGLSQGALVALMAPNSCPVVMPVLYVLPAVSQPSLLIPFYPHYCALWLLR